MPSTTISYTSQEGSRMAAAVGADLDLGRDATAAEVKAYMIQHLRSVVLRIERQQAVAAIQLSSFDPT